MKGERGRLHGRRNGGTFCAVSDAKQIIDADFDVVGGPYRVGDEHRAERGWYFTGRYNSAGHPYFMRHPNWWRRLERKHQRRRTALTTWHGMVLVFGACALALALAQALGIIGAH